LKVRLKDIGNFKTYEAKFDEGVNILEMQNATGKSVLLKSIAAAFSFPLKSRIAEECSESLGIWRKDPPQPLVRVGAKEGLIEVEFNGENRTLIIDSSGEILYNVDGDERFLFTSYLSPSSPLFRRISIGEDELKWILPAVSKVEYYERAYRVVQSILDEFKTYLEEAKYRTNNLKNLKEELEHRKMELESIDKEIERISIEIEKIEKEVDPELREEYNIISSNLEKLKKEKQEIEAKLKEVEKNLEDKKKEMKKLKDEIKKLDSEMQKVGERLKKLRTFEEIRKRTGEIEKELDSLRINRVEVYAELNLLESAKKLKEGVCPLCGSGNVNKKYIEDKLNKTKERLKNIDSRIRVLNAEKERLKEEYRDRKNLENIIPTLGSKRQQKETELENISSILKPLELETEALKSELVECERKIADESKKLQYIEHKIKEVNEAGILYERLGKLKAKRDSLKDEISRITMEIKNNSTMRLIDAEVEVERAIQVCKERIQVLEKVLEWIENKIKEQKKGFAEKFNKSIEEVIKELDFEFSALIDPDELKITIKRGEFRQPIASLSTTERSIVAVILQIALKEAFYPDIPLFIVDEIIMDFDRERATKLVEYLLKASKERRWLVILAKVGERKEIKRITSPKEISMLF